MRVETTQTNSLEKCLEAAPINMATLMAAMFAAESKACLASNASFGEMLEEPPQWMVRLSSPLTPQRFPQQRPGPCRS
jgi:hypothetical protein